MSYTAIATPVHNNSKFEKALKFQLEIRSKIKEQINQLKLMYTLYFTKKG